MENTEQKEKEVSKYTNQQLIEEMKNVDQFLKFVEDEIKKTDIGDKDE